MSYIMENMTVKEMQEALASTRTVVIPVGVVEQHGFHLPLSTDIHNAREVVVRAAPRMQAVVAPHEYGEVITSSPGPTPRDARATCNAAVPLLTSSGYPPPW